jgi:hypothetical protein
MACETAVKLAVMILTSYHPLEERDYRNEFVQWQKRQIRECDISDHSRILLSGSAVGVFPEGISTMRILPSLINSAATFFSNGGKESTVSQFVMRTGGYFLCDI